MSDNEALSISDGADALLALWNTDASEDPIRRDEKANNTDESEDNADDAPEEALSEAENEEDDVEVDHDGDAEEDDDAATRKVADDDFQVEVTIDGEAKTYSVRDLKRLAGQEVAIRQKGEEAASMRKQVESDGARLVAATEVILNRAIERYKPYAEIDWNKAAVQYDEGTYEALKKLATDAYNDVRFYQSELDGYMGHLAEQEAATYQKQAAETIKFLTSDAERGIPGFNEQVYNEMRNYATSKGIPADRFNKVVTAPELLVIYDAMMYRKGLQAKTATKPAPKANTKVLKSKVNAETTRKASSNPPKQALNELKRRGTIDAGAEALLERWRMDD